MLTRCVFTCLGVGLGSRGLRCKPCSDASSSLCLFMRGACPLRAPCRRLAAAAEGGHTRHHAMRTPVLAAHAHVINNLNLPSQRAYPLPSAAEVGEPASLPDLAACLGREELSHAAQAAMWSIFMRSRWGGGGSCGGAWAHGWLQPHTDAPVPQATQCTTLPNWVPRRSLLHANTAAMYGSAAVRETIFYRAARPELQHSSQWVPSFGWPKGHAGMHGRIGVRRRTRRVGACSRFSSDTEALSTPPCRAPFCHNGLSLLSMPCAHLTSLM